MKKINQQIESILEAILPEEGIEFFLENTSLKQKNPIQAVRQDKNFKLLLALVEMQQKHKPDYEKRAEASFTLKEYAKLRGYTDEEIEKNNKLLEELKKDLRKGASLTYHTTGMKIKNKKYKIHLPPLYTLIEAQDINEKWYIKFNPPFDKAVLERISFTEKVIKSLPEIITETLTN